MEIELISLGFLLGPPPSITKCHDVRIRECLNMDR